MREFNTLPIEEQARIKRELKAYDIVDVFFEDGRYTHGVCLKNRYADDHEYIGTYRAKDIYTEDERIENYINEFNCYPPNYKGKRDYRVMHKMTDEREYDPETSTLTIWVGKLIDGDFTLTHKESHTI